jgi:hypothetical protein
MADLFAASELRTFLIAQGVGVDAAVPSLSLPSVWLLPRDGAPQPRTNKTSGAFVENATVTLREMNFAAPNGPADLEDAYIDVIVRAGGIQPTVPRGELLAKTIHRRIRELVIDDNDAAGQKRMWMCNDLLVEYSGVWRMEQTLGADKVSFTRIASYRFGSRRKSLLGQPYTP